MNRRDFIKRTAVAAGVFLVPLAAAQHRTQSRPRWRKSPWYKGQRLWQCELLLSAEQMQKMLDLTGTINGSAFCGAATETLMFYGVSCQSTAEGRVTCLIAEKADGWSVQIVDEQGRKGPRLHPFRKVVFQDYMNA